MGCVFVCAHSCVHVHVVHKYVQCMYSKIVRVVCVHTHIIIIYYHDTTQRATNLHFNFSSECDHSTVCICYVKAFLQTMPSIYKT